MIRPAVDTVSRSDVSKSADVRPDVKELEMYFFAVKSVHGVTFHLQR